MSITRLRSIRAKIILSTGFFLLAATLIIGTVATVSLRDAALKTAQDYALARAQSESNRIQAELEHGLNAAHTLAQVLAAARDQRNSFRPSRREVNALLGEILADSPQFVGVYTVWEPFAFDTRDAEFAGSEGHDETGRFIPYWTRSEAGDIQLDAAKNYDLAGPGDYYQVPKNTGQQAIIDPFVSQVQAEEVLITSLVTPILVEGEFCGVVGVDLSLEFLQEQADGVDLYDGQAELLLISHNGLLAGATGRPELVGEHMLAYHEDADDEMLYVQEGREVVGPNEGRLEVFVPINVGQTTTPWSANLNIPYEKINQQANTPMWRMILIGAGCIALALVALWWVAGRIVRPVREITEVARAVSGGDLEVKARATSSDEIGALAGVFNLMIVRLRNMLRNEQEQREHLQVTIDGYVQHMAEVVRGNLAARLRIEDDPGEDSDDLLAALGRNLNELTASLQHMVTQLRDTATDLSASSAQILAATSQQSASASQQSAAIAQTTTTVSQVRVIAEQSVSRSQEVSGAAQRSAEVSHNGRQTMQQTIASMAQIKTRVQGIASNILALSEQTQQIGEIIATVNDIAAQSNMLALNASVEAARAGEHGKGFAVVAVEVRNLAEQSRQATAQVKAILSDIQRATNATVMATEEGAKGVDEGVRLAAQTQSVIEQLAGVIDESAQAAMQVVAGGQQQSSGIEQVALAMEHINQATTQGLSSTQQTEKAARELNELAQGLLAIVEQYRLA
jgi:methyl-accepting chemotaxis protein